KEDNSAAGKTILLPDNGNLIKDKKNDKRSKTAERLYRVATVQEPEQKELSSLLEKHKKELNRDTDVFHKQIAKKDARQAKKNGLKQVKAELKRDFEKLIAKTAKKKWFTKLLPNKRQLEKGKEVLALHMKQYSKELENLRQKRKDSKLTFTDLLKSRYIFSTIIITIMFVLLLVLFLQESQSKYSEIENRIQENSQQQVNNGDVYISNKEVETALIGETNSEIIDIAGYKNNIYVITQDNSFYQYDSNINEFGGIPISDEISDVVAIVPMPDLNLIFFVSNDSVHSFSPVMKRSDKHSIKIPANSDIIGVGTYLTFLYILDKNSGQIYRYPRAEGGFGSPIKWFSSEITTDNITDIALDDSIRVAYNDGSIEQYFKRKLVSSFLIDTQPKVVPKKIQTSNASDHYYILDSENPRVIKIGKDGNKLKDQFWNRQFEDAKDFWIHDGKEGYVLTKHNKILQFKLQ
ncbi:MAG: hypothetical protein U9M90_00415, partial [Patescibacteria group bacterium]|nr:hypothetical protein [Patescibacteria group bacterium]